MRRTPAAGLVCLATVLGLVLGAWLLAAAPPALAWQVEIKVMSYNIRKGLDAARHKALDRVQEVVAEQLPDLLAVQEINAKDVGVLARTTGFAYYQAVRSYGKENWRPRLGVLSRWPIKVKALPLAGSKRRLAKAVVDLQGIPLVFYVAHFSREGLATGGGKGLIKEFLGLSSRSQQMASVVADIKADRHRYRILAGDLNTFPLSGPYRQLSEVMQDAFPRLFGKGSYRVSELKSSQYQNLPSPKIDHIFHSQAIRSLQAYVVEKGPSDHYPVVAILALQVPSSGLTAPEIKRVQALLQAKGLGPAKLSGEMDPPTRRAISRFQEQAGLPIDGVLTAATMQRLLQGR